MWHDLVGGAVARGVQVRWARVVGEPLSPYIRYEHSVTEVMNVAAGEQVRWLPRSRTLDLCLPGLDFWLFDDHTMRVHHFAGDGELAGHELGTDPAVIEHCAEAFEAVWKRAIPHAEFEVTCSFCSGERVGRGELESVRAGNGRNADRTDDRRIS